MYNWKCAKEIIFTHITSILVLFAVMSSPDSFAVHVSIIIPLQIAVHNTVTTCYVQSTDWISIYVNGPE